MDRVLEPELMEGAEQALAYAKADFGKENQAFVDLFREFFPDFKSGHVLDLGCGPADIPIRFVQALPDCHVTGIDGSAEMVRLAGEAVQKAGVAHRISLQCVRMQAFVPKEPADAGISNSLLHHVPNPYQFWYRLKQLVKPGSPVLVIDLLRPESPKAAQAIVAEYAANEAPILQHDFYHSLLAAFTEDEIAAQLAELNLSRLLIHVVDDRHWVVGGRI